MANVKVNVCLLGWGPDPEKVYMGMIASWGSGVGNPSGDISSFFFV